jgi:hypothetical protein
MVPGLSTPNAELCSLSLLVWGRSRDARIAVPGRPPCES